MRSTLQHANERDYPYNTAHDSTDHLAAADGPLTPNVALIDRGGRDGVERGEHACRGDYMRSWL